MQYQSLGNTELKVSKISLGTWQLGGGWGSRFDPRVAQKILHAALDEGINFFDTADVYDGQLSEKEVGKIVKANRDERFIATKIGRRIDPHTPENYTPDTLEKHVDEALFNTGLDELDLVQLHCPPTTVYDNEAVFERLNQIQQKGKVRYFGVSVEKVSEAMQAAQYPVVSTVQIIFNMFRHKPLDECFPLLEKKKIGVLARVPLASGLLTGKFKPNSEFRKDDHRNFNRDGAYFDKGETFSGVPYERGLKAVAELQKIFEDRPINLYALRWILMFSAVSTVIPGASKPEQVQANAAALQVPALNSEQMQAVRDIYDHYFRAEVHQQW